MSDNKGTVLATPNLQTGLYDLKIEGHAFTPSPFFCASSIPCVKTAENRKLTDQQVKTRIRGVFGLGVNITVEDAPKPHHPALKGV